jgi:hypothetical protein
MEAAISPLAESTTAIAEAAGRNARTQIPAAVLCMPRKANGSPCRAATIASISRLAGCGIVRPARPRQDVEYALQRDPHPIRPVRQLVGDLVHGLFQREEAGQPRMVRR